MPRSSDIELGGLRDSPGGQPFPAARFPSGRVVSEHPTHLEFRHPERNSILIGRPEDLELAGDLRSGVMHRSEDESGVSGTGVVAEWVMFPSGRVVIEWRNDENESLSFDDTGIDLRPTMESAVGIHGHSGRTEFIFDDTGEVADPWA